MNAFAAWLAYSGLVALAFGMSRHHRAVFQSELPARRRAGLRLTGWTLLTGSFVAACLSHGAEIGPVAWFATVAAAGLALTLCLAYRPRFWPLPLAGLALLALL
jgi:hypothetical protein